MASEVNAGSPVGVAQSGRLESVKEYLKGKLGPYQVTIGKGMVIFSMSGF